MLMECYKFECRSCGSNNLKRVVSLGYQPLANNLHNKKTKTRTISFGGKLLSKLS